jgi:hypothetical protein
MATVGSVIVKLGGDASGFLQTMRSVDSGLTSAVGKVAKIGAALTAAVAGLGLIGAAITGKFINDVSKLGDEFRRLNIQTGISIENLSALELSAKINKTSFEALGNSLRLMQRNLSEAVRGSGDAKDTLAELGFATEDLERGLKNTDVFLEQFAKKIAAIESPAQRVETAMRVMGRAGVQMIPFLLDLANRGLSGVRAESDALGNTFSSKLAAASERFRDNMTRLGAALRGLKVTIIGPLVTAFAALTEQFLKSDVFKNFRAQIDQLAGSGKLEEWAKRTVFFIIDGFARMSRAIAVAFRVAVITGIAAFNAIQSAVSGFSRAMSSAIGEVADFMMRFLRSQENSFIGKRLFGQDNIREAIGLLGAFKNEAQVAFIQMGRAAEAAKIEGVPAGLQTIQDVLNGVANSVQTFGNQAKISFDSVREEVQRTAATAEQISPAFGDAVTKSGDLVKVAGDVGLMIDKATGEILIMNRELFGTLTLVRQINAEGLSPVQ